MKRTPQGVRIIALLGWMLVWLLGQSGMSAETLVHWEQTGGPLGGTVQALAVHPRDARTLLAGTLSGVYQSQDGGHTWVHLEAGLFSCQDITTLAYDPQDPAIIYAGSSEGLFRSTDRGISWTQIGNGLNSDLVLCLAIAPSATPVLYVGTEGAVFKSTDRGDTWQEATAGLPPLSVWSLAVHPTNAQLVYAGTEDGLFKTSDGGKTWVAAYYGLPTGALVKVVALDPQKPERLYAGTPHGLYISPDAGETWQPAGAPAGQSAITTIALSPQQPGTLYANAGMREIWRSTNSGATWEALAPINSSKLLMALAINPTDAQRLYVGAAHGFYQSADGGASWREENTGLISSDIRLLVDMPGTRGHLYAATRWGIYQTLDGGNTWQPRNEGLSNPNVIILTLDPTASDHLYAATWEGEVFRSSDGGDHWTLACRSFGDGSQITGLVAHRQSEPGSAPMILYAGTDGGGVFRSLDLGTTWGPLNEGLPDLRVGAIGLAQGQLDLIYVGAGKGLYRLSGNLSAAPSAWERVTALPLSGRVTSIVRDPRRLGQVYVATDGGSIYRDRGDGIHWDNLTHSTFPLNTKVEELDAFYSAREGPLLCAITDGGLFCSQDEGRSWFFTSTGCLRQVIVRCVAVDDGAPGVIYLGTGRSGVYRGRYTAFAAPWWVPYLVGFAGLAVVGMGAFAAWRVRRANRVVAKRDWSEQQWALWEQLITETLAIENHATAEMLTTIPAKARAVVMHRYVATHREEDWVFQETPATIAPASPAPLQLLVSHWTSLQEHLGESNSVVTPITLGITTQLCELLGFTLLFDRVFRNLSGYVVKAPTLRLGIPPSFPIIFVPRHELGVEAIRDVRDLMRVLNVTSFFALLVVVDETLTQREHSRELQRLVHGGSDDFIVLDYQDLRSLFLSRDPEARLVKLILNQIDLTVVSPYVTSGPVHENMFFGRDYELKAIMRTIRERSYAIVGGRKIGKTSVLNKVHRLMQDTSGLYPIYLDCQHVFDYAAFFDTLALVSGMPTEAATPDQLRRFILRLRRQHEGRTIALLLDEVDNLLFADMKNRTHLFRVLRAVSQEGLCHFVFCGERQLNRALHDSSSPLFNFCNVMRLSYLSPRDALRVIQEPLTMMGIQFEDEDSLPQSIVELSSCHPNLLQFICRQLIARLNARSEHVITVQDLAEVRASSEFRDFFFEVMWGNATPMQRLITVLMVERPSFGLVEVREALIQNGCAGTLEMIEAALDELVLFSLLQKQAHLYSFAARSFPQMMSEARWADEYLEGLLEGLRTAPPAP